MTQNYEHSLMGLDLSEYLQKPEAPLSNTCLIIPSVIFVICFGSLSLTGSVLEKIEIFIFLLGFAASAYVGVSVNIRFKSIWGAGAIILTGVLIMLVALGVIEPKELLEFYKKSPA